MMTPTPNFSDLITLMARLRDECPWDKKQTNQSLLKYLLEESYELVEATNADDGTPLASDDIKGELGDVLLQVVFHAHLYAEQGRFDMGDVIFALQEKLIRRHPHIFEKESLKTDEDVKRRWDEIKAFENKDKPKRLLSEVKAGTALMTAQNLQKASAKVGFDWENLKGVTDKLQEELTELQAELPNGEFNYKQDKLDDVQKAKIANELGDVLFVLSNLARHLDIDAELALQGANAKFKNRFGFVEQSLINEGKTFDEVDLVEMDKFWEMAKRLE